MHHPLLDFGVAVKKEVEDFSLYALVWRPVVPIITPFVIVVTTIAANMCDIIAIDKIPV